MCQICIIFQSLSIYSKFKGVVMKKILMVVITTSMLAACSSPKLATGDIKSEALRQASLANITPEQAIKDAQAAFTKAAKADLSYYTPLHFIDIKKTLAKIESLQKNTELNNKPDTNLALITTAFTAQKLITDAYKVKSTILTTLEKSLAKLQMLEKLGAKDLFKNDYMNIDKDLIDLFELIEQNKLEKVHKNELDLLSDMTELEVDTLIKRYVEPAELILDKSDDNDADDYAEKTYNKAVTAIKFAKTFIKTNYSQRDEVKKVGHAAVVAAKKAFNTGKLARSMVELNEEDAELKALEMEGYLNAIIQAFEAPELAVLPLQEQSQELAKLVRMQIRKLKVVEPTTNETTPTESN